MPELRDGNRGRGFEALGGLEECFSFSREEEREGAAAAETAATAANSSADGAGYGTNVLLGKRVLA